MIRSHFRHPLSTRRQERTIHRAVHVFYGMFGYLCMMVFAQVSLVNNLVSSMAQCGQPPVDRPPVDRVGHGSAPGFLIINKPGSVSACMQRPSEEGGIGDEA